MNVSRLYKEWVLGKRLEDEEAKRIMRYALKNDNVTLAEAFFSGPNAQVAGVFDILKNAQSTEMLTLWLRYAQKRAPQERTELLRELSDTKMADLLERFKLDEKEVKEAWGRKNPEVRLSILGSQELWRTPAPWLDWFIRNYPFKEAKFGDARKLYGGVDGLRRIYGRSRRTWDALAERAKGIELLTDLHRSGERGGYQMDRIIEKLMHLWVKRFKEGPRLSSDEWYLFMHTLGHRYTPDVEFGRAFLKEAQKADDSEMPEDVKAELERSLTAKQGESMEAYDLEEAVALLEGAKSVDPMLIRHVNSELKENASAIKREKGWLPEQDLDLELLTKVANHEGLNAEQFISLFKDLGMWRVRSVMDDALKTKNLQWRKDLLARVWTSYGVDEANANRILQAVLMSLKANSRKSELKKLLRDGRSLTRLLTATYYAEELFELSPVGWVTSSNITVEAARSYMYRAFEGREHAWEVFETIAKDFEGSFADLVRASTAL